MGIASLIVIGGVFSGIFYLIFSQFPAAFEAISAAFAESLTAESSKLMQMLAEPKTAVLAGCYPCSSDHVEYSAFDICEAVYPGRRTSQLSCIRYERYSD